MIGFTTAEIIISVISALIYGLFFAFATFIARVVAMLLKGVPSLLRAVIDKSMDILPWLRTVSFKSLDGSATGCSTFFKIIAFTVGIILLSYRFLDGSLRSYIIILAAISYFCVKGIAPSAVNRIPCALRNLVLRCAYIPLRLLIYPLVRFQTAIFFFFNKKIHNMHKKSNFRQKLSLDNQRK